HSCCQAPNLPWAPCTTSPVCCLHTATLCHVPLSGLLTHCLLCSIFCHRVPGRLRASHSCCRPLICHGPLYRLLMLLSQRPESLIGSLYGLPLLPSASIATTLPMCHFPVSSHNCWCV
ncbi:unnamed protein product, partial [Staurois parvus]